MSGTDAANLNNLATQEFLLADDLIYLNHAAVAPWPVRTRAAVCDFAEENAQLGAKNYLKWLEVETRLKNNFMQLINASNADDIALLKNTSEALSFVANGLTWKQGDNIVTSNQEFPSNRIVWQQLHSSGVELREVELNGEISAEDALINAIDDRTRLLTISSVQYATGFRLNLEKLGAACKQKDVLFCIDAIQSIGALDFDVQKIQADFVMADTHKWMLGPEGVCLFYCNAALRPGLNLIEYGWHMLEDMTDYTNPNPVIARSARRFECGSPNMLGIHAAEASISLLLEAGLKNIEHAVLERSRFLIDCIQQYPELHLISTTSEERLAGIVTFKSDNIESERLYKYLMKKSVICAHRGGGIRFSPHFYTDLGSLETAVQLCTASA